jgi:hypothetical protein
MMMLSRIGDESTGRDATSFGHAVEAAQEGS